MLFVLLMFQQKIVMFLQDLYLNLNIQQILLMMYVQEQLLL